MNNRPAKRRRMNKNNNNNSNNNSMNTNNKLTNIWHNIRAGSNLGRWSNADLLLYLLEHPTPYMRRGGLKLYIKTPNRGYVRANNRTPVKTRQNLLNNIKRFG